MEFDSQKFSPLSEDGWNGLQQTEKDKINSALKEANENFLSTSEAWATRYNAEYLKHNTWRKRLKYAIFFISWSLAICNILVAAKIYSEILPLTFSLIAAGLAVTITVIANIDSFLDHSGSARRAQSLSQAIRVVIDRHKFRYDIFVTSSNGFLGYANACRALELASDEVCRVRSQLLAEIGERPKAEKNKPA